MLFFIHSSIQSFNSRSFLKVGLPRRPPATQSAHRAAERPTLRLVCRNVKNEIYMSNFGICTRKA